MPRAPLPLILPSCQSLTLLLWSAVKPPGLFKVAGPNRFHSVPWLGFFQAPTAQQSCGGFFSIAHVRGNPSTAPPSCCFCPDQQENGHYRVHRAGGGKCVHPHVRMLFLKLCRLCGPSSYLPTAQCLSVAWWLGTSEL